MDQLNEAKNIGDAVVDRKTDWRVLRSLDAEVAERVMGWQRQPDYNYWMSFPAGESFRLHALIATWHPSEDIQTAMQVIEAMQGRGFRVFIRDYEGVITWEVTFISPQSDSCAASGNDLPEAICRAALAVVNKPDTNSANSIHPAHGQASKTEVQK